MRWRERPERNALTDRNAVVAATAALRARAWVDVVRAELGARAPSPTASRARAPRASATLVLSRRRARACPRSRLAPCRLRSRPTTLPRARRRRRAGLVHGRKEHAKRYQRCASSRGAVWRRSPRDARRVPPRARARPAGAASDDAESGEPGAARTADEWGELLLALRRHERRLFADEARRSRTSSARSGSARRRAAADAEFDAFLRWAKHKDGAGVELEDCSPTSTVSAPPRTPKPATAARARRATPRRGAAAAGDAADSGDGRLRRRRARARTLDDVARWPDEERAELGELVKRFKKFEAENRPRSKSGCARRRKRSAAGASRARARRARARSARLRRDEAARRAAAGRLRGSPPRPRIGGARTRGGAAARRGRRRPLRGAPRKRRRRIQGRGGRGGGGRAAAERKRARPKPGGGSAAEAGPRGARPRRRRDGMTWAGYDPGVKRASTTRSRATSSTS